MFDVETRPHDIWFRPVTEEPLVRFIGLEDVNLDEFSEQLLQTIVSRSATRISHILHNEFRIVIHVRKHENGHPYKHHKYAVHARVEYPGSVAAATRNQDWDLLRSVRQALDHLEHILERRYSK